MQFSAVVSALLMVLAQAFVRTKINRQQQRWSRHVATVFHASSLADIKVDIQQYLEIRNATVALGLEKPKDYHSTTNPLAMFKPSGWYKDEYEVELKTRTDRTIPTVSHPLSYVELERFGWGNLSLSIMELGGPLLVGEQLGMEWVEPEEEPWAESLRPVREQSYALGVTGSLQLGGALEDTLSAAAALDLESLKRSTQLAAQSGSGNTVESRESQSKLYYQDEDGEVDYSKTRVPVKRQAVMAARKEPTVPKSEKFTLDGSQRSYLILVAFTTALTYGRASQELLATPAYADVTAAVVGVSSIASVALYASAAGSLGLCVRLAKEKNRNVLVWGMKGLLGGPMTVAQLKELNAL